jgi:hypothetical protein
MSVNYFNNFLFLTQMHSLWMFLSLTTLCTLLATAEADLLLEGIKKMLDSHTPKEQQQAMTTDMEKEQKYFASEDELNKVRRCNQQDKLTAAVCGSLFCLVH